MKVNKYLLAVALSLLITTDVQAQEDVISHIGKPVPLQMEATAYCKDGITASGKQTRTGICAMKKEWMGLTASVYEDLDGGIGECLGIFEVEDTGGDERIKAGKCIDIYVGDYDKAVEFGRRKVIVFLTDAKG